jgi:hypothetical protein
MRSVRVNSMSKTEYKLELEGKVWFVEYQDGKEVTRDELNGNQVLQVVLQALDAGLNAMELEHEPKP